MRPLIWALFTFRAVVRLDSPLRWQPTITPLSKSDNSVPHAISLSTDSTPAYSLWWPRKSTDDPELFSRNSRRREAIYTRDSRDGGKIVTGCDRDAITCLTIAAGSLAFRQFVQRQHKSTRSAFLTADNESAVNYGNQAVYGSGPRSLGCFPPTKAVPGGVSNFRTWELCGMMPLVVAFLGSKFPALAFTLLDTRFPLHRLLRPLLIASQISLLHPHSKNLLSFGKLFKNYKGGLGWSAATIALAEFLGTAFMVFFICMANVVGITEEEPSTFQKSVSSGFAVAVIIQIFGHISAAHLNPAVTFAAVILGNVNIPLACVYLLAECGGAIVGYGFMQVLLPLELLTEGAPNGSCCALCVTVPHGSLSVLQALVLEGVATAFLVLMVCSCWDDRNRHRQDSVPLKFAFLITAVACILGPMTGASMNPARTLGPAVWTNHWDYHWIYWVGPSLGAIVASSGYRLVFVEQSSVDLPSCNGEVIKVAEVQRRETAVP
ncbi:hypothetical protein PR048_008451 [Dryococelus australis]|uniref:Uncharacterized protein n=1 Tax=Dryococelus australis TaxID=614101 RepID=A0ABQ9HX52_9NEOP|nr:hypothetical protein PR048_008451 [Dryococelus australis]